MAKRYTPTDEDKAEALGSVFYEIQQLWASSHLIGRQALVMNAFLESMLVHVRVLLDFFERDTRSVFGPPSNRSENDDVLSTDYGFGARPVDLHPQYRTRLNKDLAHLSYSRNKRQLPGDKSWPRQEVIRPLIERCIEFIDSLGEDALRQGRGASLSDWQRLREDLVAKLDPFDRDFAIKLLEPSPFSGVMPTES